MAVRATRALLVWLAALSVLLGAGEAHAGPPYLTDDPEPTDPGHWEIYNYVIGLNGAGGFGGEAGVDLNYGAVRNLQLTAVLPVALENADGVFDKGLRGGPGIIELAVKYEFLHQSDDSWVPDVSLFPRAFVPTVGRFSTGRTDLLLPVWAQKDVGPWSLFAGGGWELNPGPGERNFWQGGVALTRSLTKTFTLGAEVFGQGPVSIQGGGFTTVNFATTWRFTPHWSLLASAGPTWDQGGGHGQVFYVSFKADY